MVKTQDYGYDHVKELRRGGRLCRTHLSEPVATVTTKSNAVIFDNGRKLVMRTFKSAQHNAINIKGDQQGI